MAKKRDDAPLPNDPEQPEPFEDLDAVEDIIDSADLVEAENDSGVDLGSEPPEGTEVSGVSVIEWSSLVEETPTVSEPADAELLAVEGEEIIDLGGDPDSAVDLGGEPQALPEEEDLLLPPTSSAILNDPNAALVFEDELESSLPLAEESADETVEFDAPSNLPRLPDVTGVNLDVENDELDVFEPEVVGEASSVDLTGEEVLDPEVVESSSGISIHDMGLEEVPIEDDTIGNELFENSGELVLEEIVQQEMNSSVGLGEEVLLGAESPSQRDRIAEAVESGVDLPDAVVEVLDLDSTGDSDVRLDSAGDSEVRLDEAAVIPEGRSDELVRLMSNLSGTDDVLPDLSEQANEPVEDLPLFADETEMTEEEDLVGTEALELTDAVEEDADVSFDGPADDIDEAVLKTGARIPRPDSLGEIGWDEDLAGETTAEVSEEDGMAWEDADSPDAHAQPTEAADTDLVEEFVEAEADPDAAPEMGDEMPQSEEMFENPDLEPEMQEIIDEETVGEDQLEEEQYEEPEPRPDKKPKPERKPGRAGAWFGGILLGALLGGAGVIGAALSGNDPAPLVGDAIGIAAPNKPKPQQPPVTTVQTFTDIAEAMKVGNYDKAANAGVEKMPVNTPQEQAVRGQYVFQSHLRKQTEAGVAIKADDEPVKAAVADLEQARQESPEAALELANILILTGDLDKAETTLKEGQERHKDKRFDTALIRLEFFKADKAAPPVGGGGPGARANHAALLLTLLVALQEPEKQPEPAPMPVPPGPVPPGPAPMPVPEVPEAGFDFWMAMKLSREQKFSEARLALAKAIELHEKRRFLRLNKPQNPDSDPTEEIFLRACKELNNAWEARESLKKGGYLAAQGDARRAVESVLKDAETGKKDAATLGQVVTKLTDAKLLDKPEELVTGIDKVLADRKSDGEKIVTLEKDLLAAKKVADDTGKKLTDTIKERDEAQANLDMAGKLLVDAKVIEKPVDLFAGMKEIIKTAEMKDPGGVLRKLQLEHADLKIKSEKALADEKAAREKALLDQKTAADKVLADQKATADKAVADLLDKQEKEVTGLKAANMKQVEQLTTRLKEGRRAAEVLPIYLKALQDRDPTLEATAVEDVARVGRDPVATAAERAGGEVVLALVKRNEGKYADAKTLLEKSLSELQKESPFFVAAEKLLVEASDPAGFVTRQVQDMQSRGQGGRALNLLQTALPSMPPEARPGLQAQRALLQLDELRRKTNGRFRNDDPILVAAQNDAATSESANSAEGSYAAGRIAEELGQYNLASEKYREAIRRHATPDDATATRYRAALARVLILSTQPWTPPSGAPKKPAGEGKVGQAGPPDLRNLLLLVVLGIQPGELLGSPNRVESLRIADEILALGDKAPFDARASALAIKGRWTEALILYAEGLRGTLQGDHAEGLLLLIRNHPALKKDDSDRVNPVEAEKLYNQGVRLYFQGDATGAEKLFSLALESDDQDARTFYFQGLARLAQGSREKAYDSFETGARLERASKPGKAAINLSLERVQGPERRILGQVRDRIER